MSFLLRGKARQSSTGEKLKRVKSLLEKSRFTIKRLPPEVPGTPIREPYSIHGYPLVKVVVSEKDGNGYYTVVEPEVSEEQEKIYKLLMEKLYYGLRPAQQAATDPLRYVEENLLSLADDIGFGEEVRANFDVIMYYVKKEVGYGICEIPFRDPLIEEIECHGYGIPLTVVLSRSDFARLTTNIVFADEDEVARFAERLSERSGRAPNRANPIVEGVLPEGHRVAVTYSDEVSRPGTTWDVRKFPEKPFTAPELVKLSMLSPSVAAYLWLLMEAKRFVLVVGATGSGKTTLLNALLTLLHPHSKIVTVEDTAELRLYHKNWERFFTRKASYIGTKEIGMNDLITVALRYRPDYIIVGEVRGQEMAALIQAVATGHGGATTFHGGDTNDVFTRVTGLAPSLAEEFKSELAATVIVRRIQNPATGRFERKVVEVDEVNYEAGKVSVVPVFSWSFEQERYLLLDRREKLSPEEEAEALVSSSKQLQISSQLLGLTLPQLRTAYIERARLIEDALRNGITDYAPFSQRIIEYYLAGRRNGSGHRPEQAVESPAAPMLSGEQEEELGEAEEAAAAEVNQK